MKPDPARFDPARYPFALTVSTRFGDMDPNGHLNNVAIAQFFEDGRVSFNRSLFFEGERRIPELSGYRIFVAHVAISYVREAHYPGDATVGVGVSAIGTSSFGLGSAAFKDGACFAVQDATIVLKAPEGAPPIPEAMRAKLEAMRLTAPTLDGTRPTP